MHRISCSRPWFTLVEVLIAVLIFGLGLIAAYTLMYSANALSLRSKQEIIATNLLREQLELAKNVRDTNFLALRSFDSIRGIDPSCGTACTLSGYGVFRTRFTAGDSPVQFIRDIFGSGNLGVSQAPAWMDPGFAAHKTLVLEEARKSPVDTRFRYCIDSQWRYGSCAWGGAPTPYYGFTLIRPLSTRDDATGALVSVNGAIRVTAYFVTTEWGYRELSMSTLLTDFKR